MSWLLRLIPEPWASAAVAAALFVAWAYGDITGRGSERQKAVIAGLRAELATKQADLDAARRSEADALARSASLDLTAAANKDALHELEASLARRPAAGRCPVDVRDRRRLLNIR